MINNEKTNFSDASNERKVTGKKNLSLNLRFEARATDEDVVVDLPEVWAALESGLREQIPRSGKLGLQDVEEIWGDVYVAPGPGRSWVLLADIDFNDDANKTEVLNASKSIASEFFLPRDLDLEIEDRRFVLRDAGSEEELRVGYL